MTGMDGIVSVAVLLFLVSVVFRTHTVRYRRTASLLVILNFTFLMAMVVTFIITGMKDPY